MNASRNLDRQLGAWFDGQATAGVPEGLLERSLDRVDATPQRPGWLVRDRGRSPRTMGRRATPARAGRWFAVAGAVVVVALVAGLSLTLSPTVLVGPSSTPSVGPTASAGPTRTPSIVQPRAASWTPTGNMTTPRQGFTATLLPNGKVLVAGGVNGDQRSNLLASAELFDPATGSWTATGSMSSARTGHTATLLPDGKVLVAGGSATAPIGMDASPSIASAELYDPATGTWTATGTMTTPRTGQTATLLRDGKVLVAGGGGYHLPTLASAELYDPATGTWSATGQLVTSRTGHSAALLADGRVLVTGGSTYANNADGSGAGFGLTSAELYDPSSGSWTATGAFAAPADGQLVTTVPLSSGRVLRVDVPTELYDTTAGAWAATGNMLTPRQGEGVTLLAGGKVLVEGGGVFNGNGVMASAELYDPSSGSWTATANLSRRRSLHTATLLVDGRVLVAGGYGSVAPLASAELYDPGTPSVRVVPSPTVVPARAPSWSVTGSMGTPRVEHAATLLPNGKVLVAGGFSGTLATATVLSSAELYDPDSGTWSSTGSMVSPRAGFTATLLPNGKVLVAGGYCCSAGGAGALASAELYDPVSGSWTATGSMLTPRTGHTATLLPNGKVLVAGGGGHGHGGASWASAELYDPSTGSWTSTGTMGTPRTWHSAALQPDGTVLVQGGVDSVTAGSHTLTTAERYDPRRGSWTVAIGNPVAPVEGESMAVLLDGKVLLLCGCTGGTARLYDPASGTWSAAGGLSTPRWGTAATLLPGGTVLVAGGTNDVGALAAAERYDPGSPGVSVSPGSPD